VNKARKPKPKVQTGGKRHSWYSARPLIGALLTLAVAAGVVLAVWLLGRVAGDQVGPRDRYEVRFADIECDPPPGTDRPTFLVEVRFASRLPETFQLLAPDRDDRLRAAFAAHPWVEVVEQITAEPPARVTVRLKYRTPVLAVMLADSTVRVVDSNSVILPLTANPDGLPLTANPDGLPLLTTPQPAPSVEAGQPWPGDTVKRAVELAMAFHPRTLERSPGGWRLVTPDGKPLQVGP
jgi:hypothetical protein